MRILLCNYEYPPLGGGGGIVTSFLAQVLAERHDVTALTSQGPGLPSKEFKNGVEIIRVPIYFRKRQEVANSLSMLAYIPMAIREGRKILVKYPYDIINTHFVLPTGPVGDVLGRLRGIPNVLTLHGGDLYDPSKRISPHRNPLLRSWISRLLRRADAVVGNSNDTLDNMRCYYTPEIEGVRIPLGIRNHSFDYVPRSRYGFKDDEILMVTVGRLIGRKALSHLIDVINSLKSENVRLLIIGSGPQEGRLKQICLKKQLGSQILFMGYLEESEKFQILQMCDVYVSTSQHEGFGLAFLEAMQCGLPIVCYDNGGQNDFLKDQETGYLVRLNDINQFTKNCEVLIRNPRLRERIGENNRLRAQEFHIDMCAAMYEDIFVTTLSTFGDKGNNNANENAMRHHFKNKACE